MKKYELTDEAEEFGGRTLYRIKALRDVGLYVKAGELGGFIESEANLSHEGTAWVSGSAKVCGNAWVSDDAWVYGEANVSGKAEVCGDAQVKEMLSTPEGEHNQADIRKGIEDAKAGRMGELTDNLLGENKMSIMKRAEKLWQDYCEACDIHVTGNIQLQINPSEPSFKVAIVRGAKEMYFTPEEIKAVAEVLEKI